MRALMSPEFFPGVSYDSAPLFRHDALRMARRDHASRSIRQVLRDYGSPHVGSTGGFWVRSCRVDLPMTATYTITRYMPDRVTKRATDGGELEPTDQYVPLSAHQEGEYKTSKGKVIRLE